MILCQDGGLFTLHTDNTTYQMKADSHGVLLHAYYGPRIEGEDLSRLIRCTDRGFAANPGDAGMDRTYSLDTLPQEYPCAGAGDFRLACLEAETPDGSAVADLRFVGWERRDGKYGLPGLPAFHGEGWQTLALRMRDAVSGLEAELLYGVQERLDLITRAVRIVNGGEQTLWLRQAASACLDLPAGDLDLITFDGRHAMERVPARAALTPGIRSAESLRGTSSHQHNPFVVLCEPGAGEEHGLCYGAMLLYSGNFRAAAERDPFGTARLTLGIHPDRFRWRLQPGESFVTPEAALICSPRGLGPMSRQLHRAIRERLCRPPRRTGRRPVLLNSWEAVVFDFDAKKLEDIAKDAAELGVELFVLDDGWFGRRSDDNTSLGDWTVNEEKLPGGLVALAERIGGLGMELGIWMEPEMVSEDSDLYRTHPDWALAAPGRAPSRGRNQLVLDLAREEVREYVFRSVQQVLDSAPITYLKWDMNRSLTDVWSPSLPPERQGEVYHRYVLGLYEILERIRRTWPELLIEGCSGGGGRFDAGMLYYTPQIWCSDNTDAVDRLSIQYGTSFAYPACTVGAHVSASPNGQNGRVTPLGTRGTVAMAGTFGYELDLRRLTAEEREEVRRQIAFWKKEQDLVSEGEYYRLTDTAGPYTAWQFVSHDRRRALVSAVSTGLQASPPHRTLRLRGLDPAGRYRTDGGERWSGAALMGAGVPLPMPWGDYQSVQMLLEQE